MARGPARSSPSWKPTGWRTTPWSSSYGDHGWALPRGKHWLLYDSGLRVPLLVRWPGRIAPDTVRESLVGSGELRFRCGRLGYFDREIARDHDWWGRAARLPRTAGDR